MLEDLYENKSYDEVLKRTAEDRRAWRNCMRNKVPKKKLLYSRQLKKNNNNNNNSAFHAFSLTRSINE